MSKSLSLSSVTPARLPKALVGLYHYYAFEAVDHSAAFAYADAAAWAAIITHLSGGLLAAIRRVALPSGVGAAETEHATKMATFWRDKGYGSIVQEQPIVNTNADQAAWLDPYLKTVGRRMAGWVRATSVSALNAIYMSTPVPINRGKGAPFWLPSADHAAAVELHALWQGARDLADYTARLAESGPMMLPLCLTGYIRIQGSRKPVPRWRPAGGAIVREGTRVGPKVRKVQAVPFGLNSIQAGCASIARAALLSLDERNSGALTPAARAAQSSEVVVAIDLAAYDESVSYETLLAFHRHVFQPVVTACYARGIITRAQLNAMIEADAATLTLPFLAPPISMTDGALLVPTRGTIKSGKRWTSLEGTIINRCIRDAQLRESRWAAEIFNSGDDTLACSNDRRGLSRFEATMNSHGFIETIAPSATYLMKQLPEGYAYVGRMLDACVNRESTHEPSSVAQAAASIAIRRALLRGHPLAAQFDESLASAPSTPLRAAHSFSLNASSFTLMDIALRQRANVMTSRGDEDIRDDVSRALEAGLLTADTARLLTAMLDGPASGTLPERANLSMAELERLASDIGPTKAAKALRKRTDYRRK